MFPVIQCFTTHIYRPRSDPKLLNGTFYDHYEFGSNITSCFWINFEYSSTVIYVHHWHSLWMGNKLLDTFLNGPPKDCCDQVVFTLARGFTYLKLSPLDFILKYRLLDMTGTCWTQFLNWHIQ